MRISSPLTYVKPRGEAISVVCVGCAAAKTPPLLRRGPCLLDPVRTRPVGSRLTVGVRRLSWERRVRQLGVEGCVQCVTAPVCEGHTCEGRIATV